MHPWTAGLAFVFVRVEVVVNGLFSPLSSFLFPVLGPDQGGGMYTAVPQTEPVECVTCRNCWNNNRYVDVYLHRLL